MTEGIHVQGSKNITEHRLTDAGNTLMSTDTHTNKEKQLELK